MALLYQIGSDASRFRGQDRSAYAGDRSNLMKANIRTLLGGSLGIAVSAACIAVGAWRVDWEAATRAFDRVNLTTIGIGAALLLLSFLCFSQRWRCAIAPPKPGLLQLFPYLMIGYMANAILPMRPGDLVRAALLRTHLKKSLSAAFSSLVIERVFDLLVVVLIGYVATLFFPLPDAVEASLIFFAVAGLAVLGGVVLASARNTTAIKLRGRLARRMPREIVNFARQKAQPFLAEIRVIHNISGVTQVVFWTILAWALLISAIAAFLDALQIETPLYAPAVVVVVTSLGAAIPSSPAALGVYHALFVFALSLFGVPTPLGVAAALIAHTTTITLQVSLGALSSAILGIDVLRSRTPT
ncbi:MAG: lysylphosphatidylglycerol synthase transmembrane domain-containing protein [Hyphomonadaceae bacterium]